ncbi:hypothetical protein SK854_04440 [Lentzea sp. BCCO 10_0061]|uniref:Uncharacterized protein n=1 Tax=Lentzea sokolovensis TaxID=3095429 RepID=A0ABU4UQP2_9PSEU|nr:hypothetical protein [Lentzea sp. BCCO 10_0061]MDX8141349.1 hypothetical protein [Lentzea sp. BCCO 10_0061]
MTKRFGPEAGGTADEQLEECGQSAPKPGDTQTCDHEVSAPMTLFAGFGHMHLLGRAIKVEAAVAGGDRSGDTPRVTCVHDAGLRKLLPQLSKLPPRYVVCGVVGGGDVGGFGRIRQRSGSPEAVRLGTAVAPSADA